MDHLTLRSLTFGVVGLCTVAIASPALEGLDYVDEGVIFGELPFAPRTAREAIAKWPDHSKDMAAVMMQEFGPPSIVETERLIWRDRPTWKRIVVFRESRPLERPGILQQTVAYHIRGGHPKDVAIFGYGVSYDAAQGELSACSDSIATNLLALNLAEEVMWGRRTVKDAQAFYDRTLALSFAGKSSPYMSRLRFKPRPMADFMRYGPKL